MNEFISQRSSSADFNDYKSFNMIIKGVRLTFIVIEGKNIEGINNEEKKQKKN